MTLQKLENEVRSALANLRALERLQEEEKEELSKRQRSEHSAAFKGLWDARWALKDSGLCKHSEVTYTHFWDYHKSEEEKYYTCTLCGAIIETQPPGSTIVK